MKKRAGRTNPDFPPINGFPVLINQIAVLSIIKDVLGSLEG
jgi:hypothetical protein